MKRSVGVLLALLVGSFFLGSARAEIMVAPALEWLADHCPDSGIYQLESIKRNADTTLTVKLARTEVLRGDPPKEIEHQVDASSTAKRSDEFLLAFQRYENATIRPLQIINLSTPASAGFASVAVSSRLELLSDRKSILKTFRARLKKHPKVDPVSVGDYSKDNRFELEPGTKPYSAVFGGSRCYLRIPADLVKSAGVAAKRQLKAQSTKQRPSR